jgi:hypothetical protein
MMLDLFIVGVVLVAIVVFLMWLGRDTQSYSSSPNYMRRRYGPPWDQKAPVTVRACCGGKS